MSRAEEKALKAYPNIKVGEQRIDQSSAREVYVEGYNQAEQDLMEKAKIMDEVDKRKETIQDERELNPDTLTKEVSADNLEKISQRAEYNANDYIGHPFDEGEDTTITYARESYEAGFKQGWQEGETYGFDKGFDFCEQTSDIQPIKEIKSIDKIDASDVLKKAALLHSERYRMHWPNQVQPAYNAFIAGAKWQEEYWDKAMRDNHVEMI